MHLHAFSDPIVITAWIHSLTHIFSFCFICRRIWRSKRVWMPRTAEEEAEIPNGVHEPPNFWVGAAIHLPEVPLAGGQRWDRRLAGPQQRPSHYVVPESARQRKARSTGVVKEGTDIRLNSNVMDPFENVS